MRGIKKLMQIWRTKNERKQLYFTLKGKAKENDVELIPLKIKEIPVHEGVRLKCLVPQCEFYGACRICPPNLPPVSEVRAALRYFSHGFLVVFHSAPISYEEAPEVEIKLLEAVEQLEKLSWSLGYYRSMGLVVGGCKLCEHCAPLGEPCRHPYRARPSPEGLGMDLTLLARRKGIPLKWPPGEEVFFLGLLLI